jgi:hypothetical protein
MNKWTSETNEFEILVRQNIQLARRLTNRQLGTVAIDRLRDLTKAFGFSLSLGDVQYMDGGWYITHAGLMRLSQRKRCAGIRVEQVPKLCDPVTGRWVFKATVYPSPRSKGFAGFGDADPSNVSSLVRGAEMRVAETRAVNRALRKAYGIGLCSVEELGWALRSNAPTPSDPRQSPTNGNNGHQNGQPRLRDRFCLLIRQHQLDAGLVKSYGADFCGTASLREATRDQVESFINHLAERATKDRDGLVCQLNSYSKQEEVHP